MVALAILKRFWKPILAFAFFALCVWRVWSAILDYGAAQYKLGYDTREAVYKVAIEKLKDEHVRNLEKREVRNNELVTDLGQKLAVIAARPAGKPVWMCSDPASLPGAPGPAPGFGSTGSDEKARAQPPGQVRDIGPGTRRILDDGDSAIAELTALQAWVARECLRPPSD